MDHGSGMPPLRRRAAARLAIGLALAAGACAEPPAPGPNIVLVVADTLRRDHLSLYGYRRETSPHLDAFAADATVFENAIAQSPSTKPSIASLFTSTYPSQHRIVHNADSLPASHVTLAEVLRRHGYATGAFLENPVLDERFGFRQGFDTWVLDDRRSSDRLTAEPMDQLDAAIAEWLRRHQRDRCFLYVHYIDPHNPYTPPEAFQGRYHRGPYDREFGLKVGSKVAFRTLPEAIARYDEEILYIDARFGALLREIEALGVADDTLVAFLSDHGEGFNEHGLVFHSSSVYAELINIPLVVRYPKALPPGRVAEFVQHVDLFPTLLDVAGIPRDGLSLEGESLLERLARSRRGEGEPLILSEHLREGWGTPQRSVIKGRWKLVHHLESNAYELFDTRRDPGDTRNLLGRDDRLAELLRAELAERLAALGPGVEPERAEIDPALRERLESLGYVE